MSESQGKRMGGRPKRQSRRGAPRRPVGGLNGTTPLFLWLPLIGAAIALQLGVQDLLLERAGLREELMERRKVLCFERRDLLAQRSSLLEEEALTRRAAELGLGRPAPGRIVVLRER